MAFAHGKLDLFQNVQIQLIDNFLNFIALKVILRGEFNGIFYCVLAVLQDDQSLFYALVLMFLNIMQGYIIADLDVLVFFLELILKNGSWIH